MEIYLIIIVSVSVTNFADALAYYGIQKVWNVTKIQCVCGEGRMSQPRLQHHRYYINAITEMDGTTIMIYSKSHL